MVIAFCHSYDVHDPLALALLPATSPKNMKRFFRSFSKVPSCRNSPGTTAHSRNSEADLTRFPDSFFDVDKQSVEEEKKLIIVNKPQNPWALDGVFVSKSGYLVIRSFLVDKEGERLGNRRCHLFVISPHGMVVLEEENGARVYPDLEGMSGETEAKRLEAEIESTRRALNLAFKKKSRGESRLARQNHVLVTLEQELAQVMKDIKRSSRHLEALSRSSTKSRAQLVTLLQHEMSKIDMEVRLKEPEYLKQYDELKTKEDTVEFKKTLQRKISNLNKVLALVQNKLHIQKNEEKELKGASLPPEPKPKRKVKRKKDVHRPSPREQRENLVVSLLQVSDARRRGDIRQTLETEL